MTNVNPEDVLQVASGEDQQPVQRIPGRPSSAQTASRSPLRRPWMQVLHRGQEQVGMRLRQHEEGSGGSGKDRPAGRQLIPCFLDFFLASLPIVRKLHFGRADKALTIR
jgi:hypothetical protein